MKPEIVVAVISAIVALISAGLSLYGVQSGPALERKKRQQVKEELAEDLLSRFRDPLLYSAFDLQSRLFNISKLHFLQRYYIRGTPTEQKYAIESTLYVIAEYLGWVEIFRREMQFLDLGLVQRNRLLLKQLNQITQIFLDSKNINPVFRIFRGEQRAIGESMTVALPSGEKALKRECIGYATFVKKLKEPEFNDWFEKLRQDIELLAREPDQHYQRLILLQNALVDLIDFLDPNCIRFAAEGRKKILLNEH